MESVVSRHIAAGDCDIELIVSSGNPTDVLDYLEEHPDKRGLFFLDVDLQHHEIDGFYLALKIRETDPYAKIVFVTTHSELAHLTFKHKLDVEDYIIKERPEDIETRTIECILAAYKRYLEEEDAEPKYFTVNANGEVWRITHDDILFFETNSRVPHNLILHTDNSEIYFRGKLSEIEQQIPELYRCHKSYLLNLDKVNRIDKNTKEAVMTNGDRVHIAEKKMSELVGIFGGQQG